MATVKEALDIIKMLSPDTLLKITIVVLENVRYADISDRPPIPVYKSYQDMIEAELSRSLSIKSNNSYILRRNRL